MGIGDQVMAAGKAKLLHKETGKRVCIGKQPRILWSALYDKNPYLVQPSEQRLDDQIWLHDYPGARPYIDYQGTRLHSDNRRAVGKHFRRWVFMESHSAEPMEVFFSDQEEWERDLLRKKKYILINPNIKPKAPPNKCWPFEYYQALVDDLKKDFEIVQPQKDPSERILKDVIPWSLDLRELAVHISTATLVISSEGLLHHLAAAFHTPAVVFFGGFVSPNVTGYDYQESIYVQDESVLGVREATEEGQSIMRAISPEHVIAVARGAI